MIQVVLDASKELVSVDKTTTKKPSQVPVTEGSPGVC